MATKNDVALLEAGREGEGAFPSDGMTAPKLILALGRENGQVHLHPMGSGNRAGAGRPARHC